MFIATASVQCVRNIMDREDIPYGHKVLMVAIAMNHDYKHSCEVGIEKLRAQAGMSMRTAYRNLKKMEELGFIERSKDGGKFSKPTFKLNTCGQGEVQ